MRLYHGDCLGIMELFEENSIDSLVTDPPAGISFMGKAWDTGDGFIEQMTVIFKECLRVLKPGAHGLVWALPRTSHWTATALEQAGFEVRDKVCHIFGSGYPKSLNIHKYLDKQGMVCRCDNQKRGTLEEGCNLSNLRERILDAKQGIGPSEILQQEVLCGVEKNESRSANSFKKDCQQHEGKEKKRSALWGEESCMERRSDFQEEQGELHRSEICSVPDSIHSNGAQGRVCNGTQNDNGDSFESVPEEDGGCSSQGSQYEEQQNRKSSVVQEQPIPQTCGRCGKKIIQEGFGTGLKPAVEEWIIVRKPLSEKTVALNVLKHGCGGINIDESRISTLDNLNGGAYCGENRASKTGGILKIVGDVGKYKQPQGRFPANLVLSHDSECGDKCTDTCAVRMLGEPSRFFYCAKISSRERNEGLDGMPDKDGGCLEGNADLNNARKIGARPDLPPAKVKNNHPTVKPKKLMSYLCRLITPPKGIVLDPFMGSGSTGCSAVKEGFDFIGIEREKEYFEIAEKRIQSCNQQLLL